MIQLESYITCRRPRRGDKRPLEYSVQCPGLDVAGVALSRKGVQDIVLAGLRKQTLIPALTARFHWPSDTLMVCEPEQEMGRVLCAVVRGRRQAAQLSLEQMARICGFPAMCNYARHEYVERATNPTFTKMLQVLGPLGGVKLVVGAADHQVGQTDGFGDGQGPSGDACGDKPVIRQMVG